MAHKAITELKFKPLTRKNWDDFETLFGEKGVSVKLLSACIEYVKEKGGKVLEGYPIEPKKGRIPEVFAWTGLANTFKTTGFVECVRRSETRPIMRYYIY